MNITGNTSVSLPDPAEDCGGVFIMQPEAHSPYAEYTGHSGTLHGNRCSAVPSRMRAGPDLPGGDAGTTVVKPLIMLDETNGVLYNNGRHPGVRDSLSVFPTFHKMEPGSNGRYAMPPF